jgi:HNH endonuclease
MPAGKKIPGKKQIIRVIQSVARKLGRTPNQAEFVRMSGIEVAAIKRYFRWFPTAVRAAGLTSPSGQRVETAEALKDWGNLVRKLGRLPGFSEYMQEGRFSPTLFQRRFRRWSMVSAGFVRYVESGGLGDEWSDVMATIQRQPMPAQGQGRWLSHPTPRTRPPQMRGGLPEPVVSKRCVTATMLGIFLAEMTEAEVAAESWSGRAIFRRRVLPDRPLLGPPMRRMAMSHEPVNEMGVVMLFAMYAERLGFVIEFAQVRFPDCKAKLEVEPGRWQDVNVEFELRSSNFVEHGHDPEKTDVIVCWKHDWADCPERIMVLELSKLMGMSR